MWLSGAEPARGGGTVYLESYGCQMNTSDSEVVLSILRDAGFTQALSPEGADVVLLNTCAIRDKAEERVWQRLRALQHLRRRAKHVAAPAAPVVGVLGCMAERLKSKLLETDGLADVVAGPDAYRDLPHLISLVRSGGQTSAMNVQLSADETYADIVPVRRQGATSAFLSIMRGCNNMCSFCIVPFTRGRERSRPDASILDEVRMLADQGVKEVTLLGQNVNSYACLSEVEGRSGDQAPETPPFADYARGFTSVYVPRRTGAVRFGELLDMVASIDPELRIRFTSPHPKDFPDDVFHVIAAHPNICKQLHLPAQSGSSSVLERMRRGYSREAYLDLATRARALLPGVALSSDFISGFCGETEAEHADTVSLMAAVQYEHAYMFAYSRRDKTHAARHLEDDVPPETKQRRLEEVIATFRAGAAQRAAADVGRVHCVLVEGPSKRSAADLAGRTDTGKMVVFPDVAVPAAWHAQDGPHVRLKPGDYVAVRVEKATAASLTGAPLSRTTLREFDGRRAGEGKLHTACV